MNRAEHFFSPSVVVQDDYGYSDTHGDVVSQRPIRDRRRSGHNHFRLSQLRLLELEAGTRDAHRQR